MSRFMFAGCALLTFFCVGVTAGVAHSDDAKPIRRAAGHRRLLPRLRQAEGHYHRGNLGPGQRYLDRGVRSRQDNQPQESRLRSGRLGRRF